MSYPKYVITYRHVETGEHQVREFDDPVEATSFALDVNGRSILVTHEDQFVEGEGFF